LVVLLLLLRHLLTLMLSLVSSFLLMLAGFLVLTGLMLFRRLLLELRSPWPPTLFGPMVFGTFRILLRRLGMFLFRFTMRLSLHIRHKSPKVQIPSQWPTGENGNVVFCFYYDARGVPQGWRRTGERGRKPSNSGSISTLPTGSQGDAKTGDSSGSGIGRHARMAAQTPDWF
jgi:hypothetical protein